MLPVTLFCLCGPELAHDSEHAPGLQAVVTVAADSAAPGEKQRASDRAAAVPHIPPDRPNHGLQLMNGQ